jgi:hypothetical protein
VRSAVCTCDSIQVRRRSLAQLVELSEQCTCCDGLRCAGGNDTTVGGICAAPPSSPGIAGIRIEPDDNGLVKLVIDILAPDDTGADGLGEAPPARHPRQQALVPLGQMHTLW